MAITLDWFSLARWEKRSESKDRRARQDRAAQAEALAIEREAQAGRKRLRADAGSALKAVLAKHDDRLLRDIGVRREDLLGEAGRYRAERARLRNPWNL